MLRARTRGRLDQAFNWCGHRADAGTGGRCGSRELAAIGKRIGDYIGRQETHAGEAELLGRRLKEALNGHLSVADRTTHLTGRRAAITAARAAIRHADTAAANLARARRGAEEQVTDAGFDMLLDAQKALLPRPGPMT